MKRLTEQQRATIRAIVAKTFGLGDDVLRFGQTADDDNGVCGIDFLSEIHQVDIDAMARAEIAFLSRFQKKRCEQRIDVLRVYPLRKIRSRIFPTDISAVLLRNQPIHSNKRSILQ